jgi:hypothetical protein
MGMATSIRCVYLGKRQVYMPEYTSIFIPKLSFASFQLMYTVVLRWTIIPASTMRTWAKPIVPFRHIFGVVEQVTSYCSLVDMRCRPFIHWRSAASA